MRKLFFGTPKERDLRRRSERELRKGLTALGKKLKDESISKAVEICRKNKIMSNLNQADLTNRLVSTIMRLTLAVARVHLHRYATIEDVSMAHLLIKTMHSQRGLETSNTNTYVERIGSKIFQVLETGQPMTDEQIYDRLFEKFETEKDNLLNDIGSDGCSRSKNKKWRYIMTYVEHSYMVDIVREKNPRQLRYKREQTKVM